MVVGDGSPVGYTVLSGCNGLSRPLETSKGVLLGQHYIVPCLPLKNSPGSGGKGAEGKELTVGKQSEVYDKAHAADPRAGSLMSRVVWNSPGRQRKGVVRVRDTLRSKTAGRLANVVPLGCHVLVLAWGMAFWEIRKLYQCHPLHT